MLAQEHNQYNTRGYYCLQYSVVARTIVLELAKGLDTMYKCEVDILSTYTTSQALRYSSTTQLIPLGSTRRQLAPWKSLRERLVPPQY